MYFIIFVMSWFVAMSINHNAKKIDKNLFSKDLYLQQGLWLVLTESIKGFSIGYTIWFIWYCIHNYPYDLF